MRKHSIMTTTIVPIIVLMPSVALTQLSQPLEPLVIDAISNSCTFLGTDGTYVSVEPPGKLKIYRMGATPPKATCRVEPDPEDPYFHVLTIDRNPPVFVEGIAYTIDSCTIIDGSGTQFSADYRQKTDQHGTTLTCTGVEPPPPM